MLGKGASQILGLDADAVLVDVNRPLAPSRLHNAGAGELRSASIFTTSQAGHLVLLDSFDPPSNGDTPALASFEVGSNDGKHCPFKPPLSFGESYAGPKLGGF